ncbi:hypothetical protein LTR08_003579 [Meristemomyces frigidus]|nr:hypothetical protein LTR08_003579 [Meristemomyces frigidus]
MDITTAQTLLLHAATLAARASVTATTAASTTDATATATSTSTSTTKTRPASYKIVGIILAVCSGIFIGCSFVLKKVGLLKANAKYNEEAGEGYGYLKNAYWWAGMTLMIVGELCNFVAYAFTDAILVTPLGALAVVITTILSAIFLKERLSFVGKVGCFICILGSVIIPLNAPEQSAVADIQEMQHYVITPGFLTYMSLIICGCLFAAFWAGPRYGKKSMLVYLSICSLIGGLSVVCTQGLGSAILAQINGEPQFNKWFTYVLIVFVICTLVTEIIYLNKALNLFNAALVTPTYYVYFTSSTIIASAVLFQGLHGTVTQIVDVVLGFLTICAGVVLLQLAKSSKDVPDTAVFSGDLDQVRTVIEQEEPEYEPRADTIRGGAAIVRALSRVRTQRQVEELKHIHEDKQLGSINENGDEFEWDGLRRRKTVSSAGRSATGSLSRRRTVHPPLGMSRIPDGEEEANRRPSHGSHDHDDGISEPDSEVHPGFFGRIGRKNTTATRRGSGPRTGRSPVPLADVRPGDHVYGLPSSLQKPSFSTADERDEDTAYTGAPATTAAAAASGPHIQFAGPAAAAAASERPESPGAASLAPPRPPPHSAAAQGGGNKRQFSFTNVFHRASNRGGSGKEGLDGAGDERPVSRGALSFNSVVSGGSAYPAGKAGTEEERLGLVQGDSRIGGLPRYEEVAEEEEEDDEEDGGGYGRRRRRSSSQEWQHASRPRKSSLSSSPEDLGLAGGGDLGRRRTRDAYAAGGFDSEEEEMAMAARGGLYDAPGRSGERESRTGGSGRGGAGAFI